MTAIFDPLSNLYYIDAEIMRTNAPPPKEANLLAQSVDQYELWHQRFGYAGKKAIEELPGKVKGIPQRIKALAKDSPCNGCLLGKSCRDAFPPSELHATHPLELVHMDLVEYPSYSIDEYKYLLTTLDDYSSCGVIWFLKKKSDAFSSFKRFVTWAETQTERKVKSICSDRGGEFFGHEFDDYLAERGIERQLSVA